MLGFHIVYGLLWLSSGIVLSIPLSLMHVFTLAMFTHPNGAAMPDLTGFFIWYVVVLLVFCVAGAAVSCYALIADGESVGNAISAA